MCVFAIKLQFYVFIYFKKKYSFARLYVIDIFLQTLLNEH